MKHNDEILSNLSYILYSREKQTFYKKKKRKNGKVKICIVVILRKIELKAPGVKKHAWCNSIKRSIFFYTFLKLQSRNVCLLLILRFLPYLGWNDVISPPLYLNWNVEYVWITRVSYLSLTNNQHFEKSIETIRMGTHISIVWTF